MSQNSKTDWARVTLESKNDAPIPYEPEDGPYDPNNELETQEFFATAKRRGPQKLATKELISIRLSPVVLDYFRSSGEGWQSNMNEVLVEYVKKSQVAR